MFKKTIGGLEGRLGDTIDATLHDSAVGLFTLTSLRSLELCDVRFDDSFYTGIVTAAPYSPVCNSANTVYINTHP